VVLTEAIRVTFASITGSWRSAPAAIAERHGRRTYLSSLEPNGATAPGLSGWQCPSEVVLYPEKAAITATAAIAPNTPT